jgi:DnaK suppressor protein
MDFEIDLGPGSGAAVAVKRVPASRAWAAFGADPYISGRIIRMKEKDIKYFKNLLTRWLEELESHSERVIDGLKEMDESLPDPLDRAVFDSERNFNLRIRDRENLLIKKIRRCLEDIDEGVYGICESCGEEISIARLKARPVTRHCIRCKTRIEAMEKLTGA